MKSKNNDATINIQEVILWKEFCLIKDYIRLKFLDGTLPQFRL